VLTGMVGIMLRRLSRMASARSTGLAPILIPDDAILIGLPACTSSTRGAVFDGWRRQQILIYHRVLRRRSLQ